MLRLYDSLPALPHDEPLVAGAPETRPGTFFVLVDLLLEGAGPPGTVGPPAAPLPASLAADVESAAAYPCDRCGWSAGCAFVAFHRGNEYRGFAVCPACNHASEI